MLCCSLALCLNRVPSCLELLFCLAGKVCCCVLCCFARPLETVRSCLCCLCGAVISIVCGLLSLPEGMAHV
jgi:hypothetical protein